MKIFFSENKVFSTYYTFFPKTRKMIQNIKNRFNTYYAFFYKKNIFSCRVFLKNGICLHSLGYLKDLNWFGRKFSARSCEFAYNNKRGAKKGSAYSKAKAALVMDDE